MNDIYKSNDNYYNGLSEYISKMVRKKSGDVGGVHGRCIDCNRELSDEHSTLIGRGPICRSKHSLRYTMIPDVWQVFSQQPKDFHSTLNDLEESLEIDFVVVCGVEHYGLFKRREKSPYNWGEIGEINPMSKDEILRLSLLDEHEYVQHNLMTCIGDEQATNFNAWNKLVLLSRLTCGMNPEIKEVIPRRFEHYDEADYPVCDKHMESWHDDIENRTDPGCPAHLVEEIQREIWHNCEECNYRHGNYDDWGGETVYLGSLGLDVLLTGGYSRFVKAAGEIPNPYMARGYSRSRHGNAANYSNARAICNYFTRLQDTWETHFAEHALDYPEEWVDENPSAYIWDTGERVHPGIGKGFGISTYNGWHYQSDDWSKYEQTIWDFIAGSIYFDLEIDDFAQIDDEWYMDFFPCKDGSGRSAIVANEPGIEPAPKDEIWNKEMNAWFDRIKSMSKGYLGHWQQLQRLAWIIPSVASIGNLTGALPFIDNYGHIVSYGHKGRSRRYDCVDAYESEWGIHERASESDMPHTIEYGRRISQIVDSIVKANKAKEKGNVQTANPSSN